MLYTHGSDLCHDAEMRHAMDNCFEALMGAIYLDSGINKADKVFSKALFGTDQVPICFQIIKCKVVVGKPSLTATGQASIVAHSCKVISIGIDSQAQTVCKLSGFEVLISQPI